MRWLLNPLVSPEECVNKTLLVIAMALASQAVLAQTSGVVRDAQGQPIPGAVVEVVGSNLSISANEQGEFVLPSLSSKPVELHVKAPQFMHKTFHLDAEDQSLELVLNRTVMDVINVIGLPWHASNMESAQPVNVLSGEKLRDRQAATLGDTLKYEVGVHSSYYGPVSSSPIIRGLEGPRVLITQNGLDAGDASRVGPDHAVAAEATTARQIEILRGPATLFYGSGAIGGVVNVVDDRVPQSTDTIGEWRVQHDDVANDKLASGSVTTGVGNIAVHVDGFWRESDNYKIPGAAEVDHDDHDEEHDHADEGSQRLDNSATEAKGLNLGASYLLDSGFIGLSVGRLERTYGIPGHSHAGEHDGEDEEVFADLEQDRVQLLSELTLDNEFFSAMNTRLGYTEYSHSEIEGGAAITTFNNRTREARVDLFHHPLADWRGAFSVHYKHSDFEAIGEEAFTPPSNTSTFALALMEERHFGDVLIQLGARVEQVKITADNLMVNLGHHEDHDHDEHAEELSVFSVEHTSNPFSASAGAVWDFTPGYNLGLSLTHAQRTPSAAELLSFGPHIGSGMFEVGALLTVHQEDENEFHFDLARIDVELEKSNNLDISLRKVDGDFGFIVNAFYNAIDNYYYLAETGLTQESGHDHEGEDEHDHGSELPVFVYQASDANLYGFEGQFIWQLSDPLKITLTTDYTRARLDSGGDLPRIPPMRVGGIVNYERGDYSIEFSALHHFKQNKIAPMETTTDGYTLLDLQFNYHLDKIIPGVTFYVQGKNLTNEYARVHSSFLKDKAPLPARSIAVGFSGRF
jgi:iron complex outermembrane receptor protein